MRSLIIAAAALLPLTASTAAPLGAPRQPWLNGLDCAKKGGELARAPGKAVPRKLGELPPGSLRLAVVRNVDGCPVPAIVRTGYGR